MKINCINPIGKNLTNFGMVTQKAAERFEKGKNYSNFFDLNGEDTAIALNKLSADKDFILNYNPRNNKFELYSVNYNSSFMFPDPKDKFSNIELLDAILKKMGEMKAGFSKACERKQKLTLEIFNK